MSDQEATASSTQSSSDERPQQQQQKTNQPERGGQPSPQHRDRGRRRHSGGQNQPHQPQQQQRRPEPTLNMEELRELVELIAQYGFTDFELEREGIRVRLRRELPAQTTASSEVATSTAPSAPAPPTSPAPPIQQTSAETQSSTGSSAPPPATPQPAVEPAKAAAPEEDLHIITSPIVGTFYRAASPTSEPFVRIGSHVGNDTVVCIIEAMKLMNEIQAETTGEVAKIYVENGQPVEFGQPLFGIKR
jgi:acetyl-CoA carboxylase biotin carboxyl carrier protein